MGGLAKEVSGFGSYFKELRIKAGKTLRAFCVEARLDPGNISRLERGLLPPPQSGEKLTEYARALGLKKGSDEWLEFFDRAAADRGQLPKDILADDDLVEKLPLVFRTLRGKKLTKKQLDALAESIREA